MESSRRTRSLYQSILDNAGPDILYANVGEKKSAQKRRNAQRLKRFNEGKIRVKKFVKELNDLFKFYGNDYQVHENRNKKTHKSPSKIKRDHLRMKNFNQKKDYERALDENIKRYVYKMHYCTRPKSSEYSDGIPLRTARWENGVQDEEMDMNSGESLDFQFYTSDNMFRKIPLRAARRITGAQDEGEMDDEEMEPGNDVMGTRGKNTDTMIGMGQGFTNFRGKHIVGQNSLHTSFDPQGFHKHKLRSQWIPGGKSKLSKLKNEPVFVKNNVYDFIKSFPDVTLTFIGILFFMMFVLMLKILLK